MTDLSERSRTAAHAVLEAQLAGLARYEQLLELQHAAILMADGDLLRRYLDEAADLLAALQARRSQVTTVREMLAVPGCAGPNAERLRGLLRSLEAEAGIAAARATQVGRELERRRAVVARELAQTPEPVGQLLDTAG